MFGSPVFFGCASGALYSFDAHFVPCHAKCDKVESELWRKSEALQNKTMSERGLILRVLLLWAFALLLQPCLLARTASACGLLPGLYKQRKTVEVLSDAQREIDHTYVEFMKAVAKFYARGDAASVNACCETVKEDIIGFQFCALVKYLRSDRKESGPFLAAMPVNNEQRDALWMMELISTGGTTKMPTSFPGVPMPDGLLFKFVDEIFGLVKKGSATAAERYLFLLEDANGEFGEYMDDQLPKLFLSYPQQVLVLWPIFRKHRERLETTRGFTTEATANQIAAKYETLCKSGDNRCAEIRNVFVPH